jgi:hypothetical protein
MSKKRKRKEKRSSGKWQPEGQIHSVFISHTYRDHQQASGAGFTESFYEGSFAKTTEIGKPDAAMDAIYVDESGEHVIQAKATASKKLPRRIWTGLPTNIRSSSFGLPTSAEFILILMSRTRRNDVLNDIMDWYPGWVAEKGPFGAYLACWWRIGVAVCRGLLDLIQRIGEIVGKFRGAK